MTSSTRRWQTTADGHRYDSLTTHRHVPSEAAVAETLERLIGAPAREATPTVIFKCTDEADEAKAKIRALAGELKKAAPAREEPPTCVHLCRSQEFPGVYCLDCGAFLSSADEMIVVDGLRKLGIAEPELVAQVAELVELLVAGIGRDPTNAWGHLLKMGSHADRSGLRQDGRLSLDDDSGQPHLIHVAGRALLAVAAVAASKAKP